MPVEFIPELVTSDNPKTFDERIKKLFKEKGGKIEKVVFSTTKLGTYSLEYSALIIYHEGEDDGAAVKEDAF